MAEFVEQAAGFSPSPDDPFNETVATTGLFLIITAIISLAFALASWGLAEHLIAGFAGAVALLSLARAFCASKRRPATRRPQGSKRRPDLVPSVN